MLLKLKIKEEKTMVKKVTSVTTFNSAAGQKIAITYSLIDDNGNIVAANQKISRVVQDEELQTKIDKVTESAQSIVDSIE